MGSNSSYNSNAAHYTSLPISPAPRNRDMRIKTESSFRRVADGWCPLALDSVQLTGLATAGNGRTGARWWQWGVSDEVQIQAAAGYVVDWCNPRGSPTVDLTWSGSYCWDAAWTCTGS